MFGNILFASLFRDQNDIGLQFQSYPPSLHLHFPLTPMDISFVMFDVLCMVPFTVIPETEFCGTLLICALPLF